MSDHPVIIIGAGPAGLAAARECARQGLPAVVLEKTARPGGISRTEEHNGFRFDIGGHRFFTKSEEVKRLWRETLGSEFIERPRLSRIYFGGKFVAYPLKPLDALLGMGLVATVRSCFSFLGAKISPHRNPQSFEQWTENQFGHQLYLHFFKAYTEKVWGIPCSELAGEWGAQRIKGLSLWSTVKAALFKPKHGKIKTLIDRFEYPKLGPGQMYTELCRLSAEAGVPTLFNHSAKRLEVADGKVTAVIANTPEGEKRLPCRGVVSSMPFSELALAVAGAPAEVKDAAQKLGYRSLLTVNLMFDRPLDIQDTWIYIHDPKLLVGRVQCFGNWSPHMLPSDKVSSLGLECFVDEGDAVWNTPDADLIARVKSEVAKLGLADVSRVTDAFVIREPKAYPVFRIGYLEHVAALRRFLDPVTNLFPVGRYGMFRYNNMDHSILTGLYAARNLAGEHHDLWSVNADEEYHEEEKAQSGKGT